MASSLTSLTDNVVEGLHNVNTKTAGLHLNKSANDGLLTCICVDWYKIYEKKFEDDLLKRFQNTCKFSDENIKQYFLMLEKDVYPYLNE